MPFDFSAVLKPFLKQAGKYAADFGRQVVEEGLIARIVPIDGLYATEDQRYYVASTLPAAAAAYQAYLAKGGTVPQQALAAATAIGTSEGAKLVIPADPRASGDAVLVVLPNELAGVGERALTPCGFRKVAFVRARYVRGQRVRGRRMPSQVWAWVA